MICFCHFCKKKNFVCVGCGPYQPLFSEFGHKNDNFYRFHQNILRTTGLQLKLLMLIESPNIFHWKPEKKMGVILVKNLGQISSNVVKKVKNLALSISFSHMLHREYILKQEVVVVKTLEWKFKANIARNAIFQER